MTDKEKARESWWNDDCCSGAMTTEKIYECGYLAGLEAGRPKWHKVADGDLPKENMINVFALVKSNNGDLMPYVANYSHYSKEWHPDYDDEEIIEVIYWKEIIPPKD